MTNNLQSLRKDLKGFAKKCKNFKYTESALLTFLLYGTVMSKNLFSANNSKDIKVEREKQVLANSIKNAKLNLKQLSQKIKKY